jgi:pimeloyl-ACP methyl ester carboxylesterase
MMSGSDNPRRHGLPPFNVVVVHGGPGAPGEMEPVARELSATRGVLEPLQTAVTLEGQVDELSLIIERNADSPVTLIGWSWGAWLSLMVTARCPWHVGKLILVGSGPFEEKYSPRIMNTRLERLGEMEREETLSILEELEDPSAINKDEKMSRLGSFISKADSYSPLIFDEEMVDVSYHIFNKVWSEAEELRKSGKLLEIAKGVECPVVAIHGDHDPHPSEGVEEPLSAILKDFRFVLLENCGHKPWNEGMARESFFDILRTEMGR